MKLITFVNLAYVNFAHNLYLQLKNVGLHENLIIYTPSDKAFNTLKQLHIDCDIRKYTPLLFKECFDQNIWSDEYTTCATGNNSYATFQLIKHDCVYQLLQQNEYVCLIDADMIIFSNFVDDLKCLLNSKKFGYDDTSLFAIKYYLNINVCVDLDSGAKYEWIGKYSMANTGFMGVYQSDMTFKIIEDYSKLFIPHFGKHTGNIDEHILTKYISQGSADLRICSIPDSINTLSDCGNIYNPDQIVKLHCHTFHPTFVSGDKIEFIKECGQWFVE